MPWLSIRVKFLVREIRKNKTLKFLIEFLAKVKFVDIILDIILDTFHRINQAITYICFYDLCLIELAVNHYTTIFTQSDQNTKIKNRFYLIEIRLIKLTLNEEV